MRLKETMSLVFALPLVLSLAFLSHAQEKAPEPGGQGEEGQLRLRKTVTTREYRGRTIEGEERVIGRGDTLWKILIREKGLSGKRFGRYLVLIRTLNPQFKKPETLRVGDTVFIPIRPDELLGIEIAAPGRKTRVYRVKRGDHLYQLLRQQLGIKSNKEIAGTLKRVKGLNPRKKDWNALVVGEVIVFPGSQIVPSGPSGPAAVAGAAPARAAVQVVGLDYGLKLPVRDNLDLLEHVVGIMGNEISREGEEVFPLREGAIRLDRRHFPVIHNPRLGRKVILDLEEKITPPMRTQLHSLNPGTSVVSIKKDGSLHEAVLRLFSQLGLQVLPSNRPVTVQDEGVGLQVLGEWMVAAPEDTRAGQEMWIISFTDLPGRTPAYLRAYLSFKGMNLKEVTLPSPALALDPFPSGNKEQEGDKRIETWPADKTELVDAFLKSYEIPFSAERQLFLTLREGMQLDTKINRTFEYAGKKFGLLFRSAGKDVKRALEEREGIKAIEIDLRTLSSRDLIARLLEVIGERVRYREHRFPAVHDGVKDKLVLTVSGFFLPHRSLLLTDHRVPQGLQRFFSEKGLRIVHFQ